MRLLTDCERTVPILAVRPASRGMYAKVRVFIEHQEKTFALCSQFNPRLVDGWPLEAALRSDAADPWRKNLIDRHRRGPCFAASEQAAVDEVADRRLHGSLRDASQFSEHAVAHGERGPSRSVSEGIELKVDEERCGRAAVRHQVSHQGLGEIRVDFHSYSSKCYSKYNCHFAVRQLIPPAETAILLT
jgi:hypothetical protein